MKAPNIENLKATIRALHDSITSKVAERGELTDELAALNEAPPDKAAILNFLHGHIDELAAPYPAEINRQLAAFIGNWSKIGHAKKAGIELLSARKSAQTDSKLNPPNLNGIFWLLNEPIKAALAPVIDEMDLPAGISNADRARRLDALNGRLAAIDAELSSLYDECHGLGIALPDTTLSADERETRRRAAVHAESIRRNGTLTILGDVVFPDDKPMPRHAEKPRTSAYQAAELPVDSFRYDEAL